ncbi:MAG: OmpA family protein [Myxococcota bacterium]|nr:OmpA family protein [Myxococcota bacterium]
MDRGIARVPARRLRAGVVFAIALFAFGLAGCVSSGKFETLQKDRDAVVARNMALEARLDELSVQKAELASEVEQQQAKLSKMQGTYDELMGKLEKELESGQVEIQQLREGIRVNLAQEILFPVGSAELDEQGREVLTRVSSTLVGAGHRIEVEGHTDDRPIGGSLAQVYPTNWELAGARAARVVRLFEEAGIEGSRLSAVSYGPKAPVASNDDEEGRARNRRIEVKLLPETASLASPVAETAAVAR